MRCTLTLTLTITLLIVACTGSREPRTADALVVAVEQQATWVRNFNPFLSPDLARWPTHGGVYEPLLIHNPMQRTMVPWLAESWTWLNESRGLRFRLREGVSWSDGHPLTADDVAFTIQYVRERSELDLYGLDGFVSAVEVEDELTVRIEFSEPFVPGLSQLALQPIVPRHIWEDIDEPVRFTNPDPVATGPFTQVLRFDRQVFELGRNPRYWQEGVPHVPALRMPALPSNEAATLALMRGEVDWAGKFVPAIDRTWVSRDPEHHQYWFPGVAGAIYLHPNTAVGPLKDVRVRKAVSLTIDRDLLVDVAMFGYTTPAPATGLAPVYAGEVQGLEEADWIAHDPAKAGRLLDKAGWLLVDGRRERDGRPLTLELTAVAGWSDWIRALQVIARGLEDVGVDVNVRTYDRGAWYSKLQRGEFQLSLGWSADGPTPHPLFRALLSAETVEPLGTAAQVNWHRFSHPDAAAPLDVLQRSRDPAEREAATAALQHLFVDHAPTIPLFLSPSWGEANTRLFAGFPSPDAPYARLSPNHQPDSLLVLTRLRPSGGSP